MLTKSPGNSHLLILLKERYPFLLSVPHGGIEVPAPVRPLLDLTDEELRYYSDPCTRVIFGFRDQVAAYIDTPVSRMVVDLNRPPLPLPPHDPDGIIKTRTIDGREVYRPGLVPDMHAIHNLLMTHFFPYHQQIDELIDRHNIRIAFDCHSMLPFGSGNQKDAGHARPLICLGNNGDRHGRARKGSIATCSEAWINTLAGLFRDEFPSGEVAINNPFSGGFISNSHFWHKGVPWIQIEINRVLYDPGLKVSLPEDASCNRAAEVRKRIWNALTDFWDHIRD